jgi:hypothetical protein
MEARLTRLEVEFEHVRKDLDGIKSDTQFIKDRLGTQPTGNGLWGMGATVIGVALAMVGAVIGVIALFP